jgi:CRP-like cAMP-binding protein
MAKINNGTFDPKRFLASVGPGRSNTVYAKGATVFLQESAADSVFYLRKGKIKIAATSPQGKEAIVAVVSQGEFFGEECLVGQTVRPTAAIALTESEVLRIGKWEMVRLLAEEPAFGQVFTRYLLARNSRLGEDLVDQLFNSSEKRLARTLLLLANYGNEGGPYPISDNMDQATLAKMVGTTRPRISRFMNEFRRLGYITYNGHIEVNRSLLKVLLRDKR